jgi:tRNA modification GTPase
MLPDDLKPRRSTLHNLIDSSPSDVIDQALVTYFKSPRSLTGEDVVELSCHGSPVVLRRIIDMALGFGARVAEPGEFTLRALSNGKLNLAEAEAIRDLISSRTEAAARQAARQLTGELAATLEPHKNKLLDVIVVLESALEFVEDDLPTPQIASLTASLELVISGVDQLAQSYRAGHLLQDGIKLAIVGSPNAGKSSLFNRLLDRERAIVTDVPGTTRDSLCEPVDIAGVPVLLTDTAGLRVTTDGIENLGIERTHRAMSDADLVLVVVDGSIAPESQHMTFLNSSLSQRRIIALNKCDRPDFNPTADKSWGNVVVCISALTGEGLDKLRTAILEAFDMTAMESGSLLVTNARHRDLLLRAQSELEMAAELLRRRESEELVLEPLHNALKYLGEITGETTTDQILAQIFSTFCIGK